MKAKYKNTGEIVEIDSVSIVFKDITNDKFCRGDEIDFVTEPEIDWEQRRYEIAKELMKGFASNPHDMCVDADCKALAEWSAKGADALIEKLKKGGSNGSH